MRSHKYQGLGNDYIVLERIDGDCPTPEMVRGICGRHLGIGSDGILVEAAGPEDQFGLRIFNPDGSEAEKSGNGLRIFARYLWDQGRVGDTGVSLQPPRPEGWQALIVWVIVIIAPTATADRPPTAGASCGRRCGCPPSP